MAEDESEDGETRSTATRHPYTNDALAGALVLFAIGLSALYVHHGQSLPGWLAAANLVAILTAVVWAFGAKAFAAAKDAVGGQP